MRSIIICLWCIYMSYDSLHISAQGMQSSDALVRTLSNNIANIHSKGFKSDVARFTDIAYQTFVHPGTVVSSGASEVVPVGVQFGGGSKLSSVSKDFTQGDLVNTENKLDVAIEGKGMFAVDMPDGSILYTRDGDFHINSTTLQITTAQGHPVSPGITLPENYKDVFFKQDGTVWVTVPGEIEMQQVGRLEMYDFINPAGLRAQGEALFSETEASGPPVFGNPSEEGFGVVMQGYMEGSNVNPMVEMVNLIKAQRSYEMNAKCMEASGHMQKSLNNTAV